MFEFYFKLEDFKWLWIQNLWHCASNTTKEEEDQSTTKLRLLSSSSSSRMKLSIIYLFPLQTFDSSCSLVVLCDQLSGMANFRRSREVSKVERCSSNFQAESSMERPFLSWIKLSLRKLSWLQQSTWHIQCMHSRTERVKILKKMQPEKKIKAFFFGKYLDLVHIMNVFTLTIISHPNSIKKLKYEVSFEEQRAQNSCWARNPENL